MGLGKEWLVVVLLSYSRPRQSGCWAREEEDGPRRVTVTTLVPVLLLLLCPRSVHFKDIPGVGALLCISLTPTPPLPLPGSMVHSFCLKCFIPPPSPLLRQKQHVKLLHLFFHFRMTDKKILLFNVFKFCSLPFSSNPFIIMSSYGQYIYNP